MIDHMYKLMNAHSSQSTKDYHSNQKQTKTNKRTQIQSKKQNFHNWISCEVLTNRTLECQVHKTQNYTFHLTKQNYYNECRVYNT